MRLSRNRWLALIAAGLSAALLLALFSPLASKSPDGLERVAEDQGFARAEKEAPFHVLADYAFPWVSNEVVANSLAGVAGVLIVAGVASGLALVLARRGGQPSDLDSDT